MQLFIFYVQKQTWSSASLDCGGPKHPKETSMNLHKRCTTDQALHLHAGPSCCKQMLFFLSRVWLYKCRTVDAKCISHRGWIIRHYQVYLRLRHPVKGQFTLPCREKLELCYFEDSRSPAVKSVKTINLPSYHRRANCPWKNGCGIHTSACSEENSVIHFLI